MSTSPQVPNAAAAQGPGTLSADALARAYQEAVLRAQEPRQAPPGTATVQPNFGGASIPQVQPYQQQQIHPAQAYGPGQGGAARKNDAQNLVRSVQNLAGQIGQQVQQRKQREYEQVVGQYTASVKGIQDAQAQLQQAKQLAQQGAQRLQQNPNDPHGQQMIQQAKQLGAQAQQGLKQNQLNLNDLANNPKQHKVITKAFGIDDKNANTPERMAAIKALRQTMGVGQQAANLTSHLPQTAQLSPQAQQQAEAVKAGAISKPATEGQVLSSVTQMAKTATTEAGKNQRASMGDQIKAVLGGMKYDPSGNLVPMTPQEIAKNPVLSSKMAVQQAHTALTQAQTQLTQMKTTALPEQVKMQEARVAALQGNLMMRQKEFGIKLQDEERKRVETDFKTGSKMSGVSLPVGGQKLNSWAQQALDTSVPVLNQVNGLLKDLEPLKDNNTAGYLASARLGYAMGLDTPEGKLGADISNIELGKVIESARILKGSSRSLGALQLAMVHTPNAWKDSPALMYKKLQNIKTNLEGVSEDAVRYGGKNLTQEEAERLLQREQPSPTGMHPGSVGSGQGAPAKATMKVPGSDGKLHWSDGKNDLGVVQ